MSYGLSDDYRQRVLAQKTIWSAGAYDAFSAKMIERAGFDAVMTSGFGVSASLLGMPDAELYTMTENAGVVRNVANAVNIPVVADMDTGYGNAINVMRSIREFEGAGASAVIIEDQVAPKRCPICVSGVEVVSIDEGTKKIEAAVEARRNPNMLIIARTDAASVPEAIMRAKAYVAAGADVIQPISNTVKDLDGLKTLRTEAGVPLSLQILGWLERDLTPEQISSVAGMATFALVPLMTVTAALEKNLAQLIKDKTSKNLELDRMDHKDFMDIIGFPEIEKLQLKFLEQA
jgi:2-methylisocitrate lyase-like PEP mutase family enzyme